MMKMEKIFEKHGIEKILPLDSEPRRAYQMLE